MEILYKDKNVLAVFKSPAIASQPDPTGDKDAMTLASGMLSDMGENSDLYLVHRLDRVVGGILVFARNKKSAAALSELISTHAAEKDYLAVVDGVAEGGRLVDLLFKDSAAGKSFVVDRMRAGVKEARLTYEPIKTLDIDGRAATLVKIRLETGRFHQIRAQFSSRKMSLLGDKKYGSRDAKAKMPALFAYHLGFELFGKRYDFEKKPDTQTYPWSCFGEYI